MFRHHYKPYNSDSDSESDESGSDSDYSSSDTSSSSSYTSSSSTIREGFETADYKALADGLAKPVILDTSGQLINNINTAPTQFGFEILPTGTIKPPPPKVTPPPPTPADVTLEATSQSIANVVMIDSRDRDITAYPQPTSLTLRLPRTYKNVTAFNVVQMKLLSAFYYFRPSKENVSVSILELGRTIPNKDGIYVENLIKSTIRQGTYDINGLINELTVQMNKTPLFYDFVNGFTDFATKFSVTGDFSLNFNFAGDTYYDALLRQYIPNPTMTTIISKYFVSQFANLTSYTVENIKIAYYYPPLKEACLDANFVNLINFNLVTSTSFLLDTETPFSRVVYTFQGIFDPVVLELINLNVDLLTKYRLEHTFRYSLINKYVITYQTQSNQITISSPNLNTSLFNLLTFKRSQYFAEQLSYNGLTQATFNTLNSQTAILLAILTDMVNFYQTYLAIYFGINYNTYTRDYLLTSEFYIGIRDGFNAVGVTSNFSATAPQLALTSNVIDHFRRNPHYYWNRMSNLSEPTIAYMNPVISGESGDAGLNYDTWNNEMDQQDSLHPIVLSNVLDPNNPNTTEIGNLYVNRRTQFADVIIPTKSSKYTVFRFKSPVRQTLRVETLPRPTKYRYPAYNQIAYDVSRQNLFDLSYCFIPPIAAVDVSSNTFNVSELQYIPGFSTIAATNTFGVDYETSKSYWGSNFLTISIIDTRTFNTFYTPFPPSYTTLNAPAYTYPFRLTFAHSTEGQPLTTPLNCFVYQDRSAFMADISGNGNENPQHYSYYISTIAGYSTINLDFTAYANKQYFVLLRPILNSFATETLRIIPNFPSSTYFLALTSNLVGFDPLADPTSNLTNYNYAQVNDPNFIRVPTSSNLYPLPTLDESFTSLTFSTSLMGYDTNGVSTDLTNYIGFLSNVVGSNSVPTAKIRTDPTNGYIVQVQTPYDASTSQYFPPGSSNSILYPAGADVYVPTTIPVRQKSIVNWYGNVFIPPSKNQLEYPPSTLASIPPYTETYPSANGIGGYQYYTRQDVNGNTYLSTINLLNLGDGVMGIGFLPEQGVWDIDQFMFKSIFTTATNDPNSVIRHIAIYPAVAASNQDLFTLQLSNAYAVLSFTSSITYNSSNQNFGFDVVGGTYYEFKRNTSYLTGSNSYMYGYTQSSYEYDFDMNMYYIAVPFDASSNIQYYHGLVGSAVPYPLYGPVESVDSVPSPDGPISPPTGAQFIVPNGIFTDANPIYGPPTGYTVSQSKYEQSMTSVTNLVLYAKPYPIATISNVFKPADPLTYEPTEIIADCSGFIMTYDSVFRVYSYPSNTSTLSIHEVNQFTLDQIYPTASNIQYLTVSANESKFAFFGLSNASPAPYIYIRTLDPKNGTIQTAHTEISPLALQSSVQLFKATYNNFGGYTLSAQAYDVNTDTSYLEVISKTTSATSSYTSVRYTATQSNITNFIVQQSPKETNGRFWVFPYRNNLSGPITEGINDFFFVNPNDPLPTSESPDYTARIYSYYGSPSSTYATITPFNLSSQTPSVYCSPIVTRDVELDKIYLLTRSDPEKFYEATTIVSTVTTQVSQYAFPSTPTKMIPGANGAQWANIYKTLYANRNDGIDGPKKAGQMWQIFNPVQRIVFHQISKNFSFLLDLSGRKYPEYPHTAISVYDSSGNITRDTNRKWGLESSSNFLTADFDYNGYYFNAYNYIAPLNDNRATDDYYYISIRNYFPTEQSQVTLRISAPNKHTFGYVTPIDLSGEISTATYIQSTNSYLYSRYWDPVYVNSIIGFNSNFTIDSNGRTFGGGIISGYPGSNISSVTGFGDFYGRMKSIYSTYSTLSILASTINTNTNQNLNNFILSDMQYIIPASALNRQRSTDPLRFSIKWKSALLPNYLKLEDNWGLGWNLGYIKEDTPFATVQPAPSFFKLIDDFIRLRLNQEFDMNRMDTISKENLSQSMEPTGQTKTYYGKLLLANFGSYAQTLVSNPIAFLNPLGKLDKLTFQWLDATNAVIDNNDCEWNAVVQITEKIEIGVPKKEPPFNQTLYS
jgi:hypothetical protein